MSDISVEFSERAQPLPNLRELCTSKLGGGKHGDLYAAIINTGVDKQTDALPCAALIWDKETDLFGLTFPHSDEKALFRLGVHFFPHLSDHVLEDSGNFKPLSEVFEHLPRLADKDISIAERGKDRIMNNLTHDQALAVLDSAASLNHGLKQIAEYRKQLDASLKLNADNAFTRKPPQPATPAKPAAKKKKQTRKKPAAKTP